MFWQQHKRFYLEYTLFDPSLEDFLWELLCCNNHMSVGRPDKLRSAKLLVHVVLSLVWRVSRGDLTNTATASNSTSSNNNNASNSTLTMRIAGRLGRSWPHIELTSFRNRIRRWNDGLLKVLGSAGDEAAQWFIGMVIDQEPQHNYTMLHLVTCPYTVVREEFATLVYFCVRSVVANAKQRRNQRRKTKSRAGARSLHRAAGSSSSVSSIQGITSSSMSSISLNGSLTGGSLSSVGGGGGGGSGGTGAGTGGTGGGSSAGAGGSTASDRNVALFALSRVIMHLVKLLSKIGDSFPHQAEEVFRLLYLSLIHI